MVPLSEMFGYSTALRSRTQGRGVYTMQPEHYEPVPKSIQEKAFKNPKMNFMWDTVVEKVDGEELIVVRQGDILAIVE